MNAEDVPFVVVPTPFQAKNISFLGDTGIGKGDLAVAVKGNRCSFGVVGDAGPYFRLGEASIATHADLDNPQCAVAGQHPCRRLKAGGVGIGSGVTYVIFPGTRPQPLLSQTVVQVAGSAAAGRALTFFQQFAP